ncbi:hypothetical protein JHK82_054539 [Glycine max]|nr:hypothetical protein JHK82_054539 [Glycine max]
MDTKGIEFSTPLLSTDNGGVDFQGIGRVKLLQCHLLLSSTPLLLFLVVVLRWDIHPLLKLESCMISISLSRPGNGFLRGFLHLGITYHSILKGTIPCLLQLLTLPFIPDSPRWLVSELFIASGILLFGHYMHFGHRSLDKHSTSDKCNLLQTKDYTEALQQQTEASIVGLFQSQYLKTLLFTTKQKFFSMTGFSDSIGTIAMVAVKIPLTTLGVLLMDKCGRRPLLLVKWLRVYMGSFLLGLAGIPWVIMSEVALSNYD